jgi:class 3 adenylate cyclase
VVEWGAAMDVGGWLRSLGLGKYEAAFRENEINEQVLTRLTQEDLKEMGVGPIGHRRTLLEAIAALRADAGGNGPSAGTAATSSAASLSPEDRAERRQVTVMFSDLVGSTALSAQIDPEDLREVISAYQKSVAETVGRFGGFVAKYMGDGVLVYFGYPQAQEDDPERAVRAGLDLVAAVAALKTLAPLQARVGIATGLVVVGDLIGSGESQERGIAGEPPNLAARLQGLAEPNTVVIAESTRRLLGNLFELADLGLQDIKGIAGPVRAFAALRASAAEGRFAALRSTTTPLVGRDEEVALLLRRWQQAKDGDGHVVLISGEPGIGKSRLAETLVERLAPSRTRGFATSARRIMPTARSIRASPSSNARQAFAARIPPNNGWRSWRRCWRRAPMISQPRCRCLRTCCQSRPSVTPRSISPRRSARRRRYTHNWRRLRGLPLASRR